MSWDLELQTASFAGIEFQYQSIEDELNRRVVEYSYPWRDGADLEDQGREPRRTRHTAIFMGDDYLSKLGSFIQVIDSGESGTFVHPLMGEWQAKISRSTIRHSHDARDMATVDIEVMEDGTSTSIPELFSVNYLEATVYSEADALIALAGTYQECVDAANEAKGFADEAKELQSKIETGLNKVRKTMNNAERAIRNATDVNKWPLVRGIRRTSHACQRLSDRIMKSRPKVMLKRIQAAVPIHQLAHDLYGDFNRGDELLGINPVRNPFIVPLGTELKVHNK